ncbi:MAG: hypothetical protein ACI965_000193 [Paraglaciecola sp.]
MQSSLTRTFKRLFYLLLACQAGALNAQVNAQDWKLERQARHITVSSQLNDAGYKNILATTVVKSRPGALLRLLDDVARAPQWIANCIAVEVISAPSDNERIVHSYFAAPWPIKDRDMLTYSVTSVQGNSLSIDISGRGKAYPLNVGYVRMQDMFGQWRITELTKGHIQITYQGGGNPAGEVPRWLANKAVIDATFATFINLREVIVDDKYQQAQISSPTE